MQKTGSKNGILIIIILVAIGGAIYFYTSGTPVEDTGLIVDPLTTDSELVGGKVLTLLNQINSLKIEKEFFTSEAYSSLVDHTVPIYEQNVGKSNPFFNPNRRASTPR